METKDCNGNIMTDGDRVHQTKDLKVKGLSKTLKQGNVIKGIRLTPDSREVECRDRKKPDRSANVIPEKRLIGNVYRQDRRISSRDFLV